MTYWSLEIDRRSGFDLAAQPCTIITYRTSVGHDYALIEGPAAVAELLGQQLGVTIGPAADDRYVDASGDTYEVSDGGTRCTYLGRA